MDLTRRQTLSFSLAGAVGVSTVLPLSGPAAHAAELAADDPFEPLLARAEQQLTGGPFDPIDPDFAAALGALDAQSTAWLRALDTSSGRVALWPELSPASSPDKFGQSYPRLRTIALAWATPGTSLTARTDVLDTLITSLRFLHTVGYHPNRTEWATGGSGKSALPVP